jgi:excinuclease ABC subunit B
MAEELAKYLTRSIFVVATSTDIDTLERIEIMQDLRKGFDVLIGVNLLRDWIYRVSLGRSWMPIKKAFT